MTRVSTLPLAALLSLAMFGAAQAQTIATATTDLNIRSGPGPEHAVIGHMGSSRRANVIGCIEGSLWCQIDYRGLRGWAYSQYMTLRAGNRVVVIDQPDEVIVPSQSGIGVPSIAYQPVAPGVSVTTGFATPVISGEIVAPRRTVSSGTVYASSVMPPPRVNTYVNTNPLAPVTLEGEVVVGAGLPREVTLQTVPDYRYQYVYVNGQPVLVDPATRRIVYVFR